MWAQLRDRSAADFKVDENLKAVKGHVCIDVNTKFHNLIQKNSNFADVDVGGQILSADASSASVLDKN